MGRKRNPAVLITMSPEMHNALCIQASYRKVTKSAYINSILASTIFARGYEMDALVNTIKGAVCDYYGVTMDQVRSSSRENLNIPIVSARHMLCYFLYRRAGLLLKDIGVIVNRDHASVLHGIKKVEGKTTLYYPDHITAYEIINQRIRKHITDCII